jgi:hypothetical protein|tara:strand:+ start:4608 stop:5129 length:522 start_codon:yes stop_codon:yes gene_type:complete
MRRILVSLAIVMMLTPTVSAHGADTFAFILRGESVQPESAQVLQNDTLIFYNVVDYERNISLEGPYGEEVCTAGPSSPGIEDECRFWLDPEKYGPETYGIQIFSNGSWWGEVVVTIVLDNHTESGAPMDYSFNNNQDDSVSSGDSDYRTLTLAILAVLIAVAISRRNIEGSDE